MHKINDPLVMKMAAENYYRITLKESRIPKNKFGDLYIGINDYSAYLPRMKKILVCETIYRHLSECGGPATNHLDTRDDVEFFAETGVVSAIDAHAARLAGDHVYPNKVMESAVPVPEKKSKK